MVIALESTPVGSSENSSVSEVTTMVEADLEEEWSIREEKLSVETSGGVGDGVRAERLSGGRRRSRRRSTDTVAERIEKEGSIGSSRRKVETRSPGPMGEEGAENEQWYIGRRALGDWIGIGAGGGGEGEGEGVS